MERRRAFETRCGLAMHKKSSMKKFGNRRSFGESFAIFFREECRGDVAFGRGVD
jgi:hypothetical protein